MELQMQPLSTRPARNPLFCASMAQARPVGPAPITRRSKAGSVAVGTLVSLMAVGMGVALIAERFVPPNSPGLSSFFRTLLPLEDSCCKLACKPAAPQAPNPVYTSQHTCSPAWDRAVADRAKPRESAPSAPVESVGAGFS